jgi:hypothetical protein
VIRASGNFFRTASIAGVVKIRSPIRFSWSSRMFTVAQGSACLSLAKHPMIFCYIERRLSARCLCVIA